MKKNPKMKVVKKPLKKEEKKELIIDSLLEALKNIDSELEDHFGSKKDKKGNKKKFQISLPFQILAYLTIQKVLLPLGNGKLIQYRRS